MVVTFSDNPHLWIGLILEHRLKTTSIISFHLWQRINVFYLLCLWHRLLILTSAWFVQNLHSSALECAGSFVEVRFIDFFLCTDWISQYPFRPLVFKDNRRVLRPRLPYCLTVVWVWSNKESVEYRRSRHHCNSRPRLDSLGQYTWLVVSKPCFPANLQQHTLISKMLLLVWESPLLPTDQCLQCLWGRENIFVSFQLLLCYCFSSTLQFSQLPIVELQVLLIRFVVKT